MKPGVQTKKTHSSVCMSCGSGFFYLFFLEFLTPHMSICIVCFFLSGTGQSGEKKTRFLIFGKPSSGFKYHGPNQSKKTDTDPTVTLCSRGISYFP